MLFLGCELTFNLKKSSDLKNEFDYRNYTEELTFFYSVDDRKGEKLISMAIRNSGGRMLSDLSMTIVSLDEVQYNYYLYLDKIKTLSSKFITFAIPYGIGKLKIRYEFMPVAEDKFLNRDDIYEGEGYKIEKEILILIP